MSTVGGLGGWGRWLSTVPEVGRTAREGGRRWSSTSDVDRGERGSATVWVLAFALLACALASFVVLRTAAVLARHRAESAADLAALAAGTGIGTSPDPCAAARRTAHRNGARLSRCALHLDASGRAGTVAVQVVRSISLPLVGARAVTASARAARLPAQAGTT